MMPACLLVCLYTRPRFAIFHELMLNLSKSKLEWVEETRLLEESEKAGIDADGALCAVLDFVVFRNATFCCIHACTIVDEEKDDEAIDEQKHTLKNCFYEALNQEVCCRMR